MNALLALSRGIDWLNERVGRFALWLILASAIISALNAVVRKVFDYSLNAFLEIQWYLFAAVFLLAAGYTFLHNEHVRIDGRKTWISNGGIADFYVLFARSGEAPGAKGLSAYVVDADTPGLTVAERIDVIAPHPLATLNFDNVRIPAANRLGKGGEGFKVAMATLDIFRSTVGAAALGFARRALTDMIARANTRKLFGAPLGDLQLTQAAIADSETEVDASALLVYRAAWTKDNGAPRVTREAAIAKMFATEAAQRVIDRAVQLYGGLGVTKGVKVEELYREIRALRIYEGATEVQKIVIGREALKRQPTAAAQ